MSSSSSSSASSACSSDASYAGLNTLAKIRWHSHKIDELTVQLVFDSPLSTLESSTEELNKTMGAWHTARAALHLGAIKDVAVLMAEATRRAPTSTPPPPAPMTPEEYAAVVAWPDLPVDHESKLVVLPTLPAPIPAAAAAAPVTKASELVVRLPPLSDHAGDAAEEAAMASGSAPADAESSKKRKRDDDDEAEEDTKKKARATLAWKERTSTVPLPVYEINPFASVRDQLRANTPSPQPRILASSSGGFHTYYATKDVTGRRVRCARFTSKWDDDDHTFAKSLGLNCTEETACETCFPPETAAAAQKEVLVFESWGVRKQ